jgi:hypothetical protein
MLNQQLINLGIVAIGAIALCVTAYFMFGPGQKSTAGRRKQPAKQDKPAAGREKKAGMFKKAFKARPAPEPLPEEGKLPGEAAETPVEDSGENPVPMKTRRSLIKSIRELRGRIPRPAGQGKHKEKTEKEAPAENQAPEVLVPDFDDSPAEPEGNPEKTLVAEILPEIEGEIEPESPEIAGNAPVQEPEYQAVASGDGTEEEEIQKNLLVTSEPETTDEQTRQEAEKLIFESEQEKKPEEEKSGNIFDLFKDEMQEETASSKLAARLDPVDIGDLLEEARKTKNHMR